MLYRRLWKKWIRFLWLPPRKEVQRRTEIFDIVKIQTSLGHG